jgi:hypothetical protein
MLDKPPNDPADHAADFARRYEFPLDEYCAIRMQALGIPKHLHGATDFDAEGKWKAFIAHERQGGNLTDGISINSGVLNPKLLKAQGSRIWPKARLRDRIDAVIAHDNEEVRTGSHQGSLKAAPKTNLPITDGARRILRAMGR